MKKIFSLFAAMLLTISAFAQRSQIFILQQSLEGTFYPQINTLNEYGEITSGAHFINISGFNLPNGALYSSGYTGNEYWAKAYDANYNVILDKKVQFSLPDGYTSIVFGFYSKDLQSYDKELYLLCLKKDGASGVKDYAMAAIFDKDGKLVQELCTADTYVSIYPSIYNVDGFYKMLIHANNFRDPVPVRTYVFNLQGKYAPASIRMMNLDSNAPAAYNLDGTPATANQIGVQILINEQGEPMKILKH